MSLNLDKRQRAMLQEMGIHIWSPAPPRPVAPAQSANKASATPIHVPAPAPVAASVAAPQATSSTPATPPTTQPPPRQRLAPAAPTAAAAAGQRHAWQISSPSPAFSAAAADAAQGGWLIVQEGLAPNTPVAQHSAELLTQMLRAMRLDSGAQVLLAPVWRQPPPLPLSAQALDSSLPALLAQPRPRMLLLLGLGAARALLGGSDTLEQLRQRRHQLPDGTAAVVSFAPDHLLRNQANKALAWGDLCQALDWFSQLSK